MDPSTSPNNVYQLKTGAPVDPLQTLRATALQAVPPVLSSVLAGADDALFDLVQKSHSTFEQQQFFEAMRELRRQRGGIEQRYREHLIAAFAALEKRKPLVAHYAQPGETSNELSLLDEEELEEQLASEQGIDADGQHLGDVGHTHRHPGMPGVRLLYGIHAERAYRVGKLPSCRHRDPS